MSELDNDSSYDIPQTGSITALNGTFSLDPLQKDTQAVSITGTWVATLAFEASNDGSNWFSIQAMNVSTKALVTSTSSNANFVIPTAGYSQTRVRASAFTSGTVNLANEGAASPQVVYAIQPNPNSLQISTTPADSQSIDPVGRQRVSEVSSIGAYCFYSGIHDLDFNSQITGSSTVTFSPNNSSTRLTNTTSSSDSIIRQTKRYFSYAPGIGHSYSFALVAGAKKSNVVQRWGNFDANDGVFFEQTSTDLYVVIRSSASGSPVDTKIAQANWNIDTLDGNGSSGATLNTAFHNRFIIDLSWHGAGRVRFGVFLNGKIVYCHAYEGANNTTTPYTRTPKLPLRVELINTGTTASSTTMDMICLAATQESSAAFEPSYNFSKSNTRTGVTVGSTLVPIISLRAGSTFNSITNRTSIFLNTVQALTSSQPILIQVIENPTLTGASFSSVNSFSSAEFDVSATAISGGVVLAEFYVSDKTTERYDLSKFSNTIVLSTTISGAAGSPITIAGISTAGNSTTWAAIQWEEAQ